MRIISLVCMVGIIITFMFIPGCIEQRHQTVPGIIIVFFPSGVNLTEANETITKHNCTVENIFPPSYSQPSRLDYDNYTYEVRVPIGEEEECIEIFENEPLVSRAIRMTSV